MPGDCKAVEPIAICCIQIGFDTIAIEVFHTNLALPVYYSIPILIGKIDRVISCTLFTFSVLNTLLLLCDISVLYQIIVKGSVYAIAAVLCHGTDF